MYSFHVYEKVIPYILNALISKRNKFSMRTNINVAMEENETSIKKQVKQTLPKSIIVRENWFTQQEVGVCLEGDRRSLGFLCLFLNCGIDFFH